MPDMEDPKFREGDEVTVIRPKSVVRSRDGVGWSEGEIRHKYINCTFTVKGIYRYGNQIRYGLVEQIYWWSEECLLLKRRAETPGVLQLPEAWRHYRRVYVLRTSSSAFRKRLLVTR